jgi:hypothetical protein
MSRGTNRTTVRIPSELETSLQEIIERSELYRHEGPHNMTSLILASVKEKIAHMERSRKSRKSRKPQFKLDLWQVCEECREVFPIKMGGSIAFLPDGGKLVCCALCSDRVDRFAEQVRHSD